METIGERLKQIRKDCKLTQSEFGNALGVTKQAIANVESNHSNPSIDFLCKLIEIYNININWLISGIGETFIQKKSVENISTEEFETKVKEILKKSKAHSTFEFD